MGRGGEATRQIQSRLSPFFFAKAGPTQPGLSISLTLYMVSAMRVGATMAPDMILV